MNIDLNLIPADMPPDHKLFIAAYFEKGHNATQAYLAIRPDIPYNSARVRGHEYVTNCNIRQTIDKIVNNASPVTIQTKDHLQSRFERIADKSELNKDFSPAVKALENIGKLRKYYSENEDGTEKFTQFIQQFNTVNILTDEKPSEDACQIIDAEIPDTD